MSYSQHLEANQGNPLARLLLYLSPAREVVQSGELNPCHNVTSTTIPYFLTTTTILRNVTYQEQKCLIRSQVASEFDFDFDNKPLVIETITEKIMAREFNRTFYRGEGQTTGSGSTSSLRQSRITRTIALLRGMGIALFAIGQALSGSKKSRPNESIGWVYAIPSQFFATTNALNNLEEFLDSTLRNRGIKPPARYFLQSGVLRNQIQSERIHVVLHIGSKILSMESQSRIKTVCEIATRTLFWIKTSLSHPIFVMVGPEFIVEIPAIQSRINRQSEVLITTQSQLLSTPLAFKSKLKASRVMYWYSNNSMQISKQKSVNLDYSYLSQPVILEHFVWTSTWGKFLEERNTDAVITVIGPILFKNLSKYVKSEKIYRSQTRKILVFDVTPKKNAGVDSIYSEKEMTQFVSDIAVATNDMYPNALIKLKPKRKYTSDDSISYCDFLEAQSSKIQILKWDSDIGNEISKSDLVICVPYSSPALIAKYLGIPTIFYTPSLDFKLDLIHDDILVVQGSTELRRFLEQLDN